MFSYSQPHSAYSYMQRRNESSNLLADAAQKGIALLNKQIDYQLLNAFQNYIISVLNIVSQKNHRTVKYPPDMRVDIFFHRVIALSSTLLFCNFLIKNRDGRAFCSSVTFLSF